MKKSILYIIAVVLGCTSAMAESHALYVKDKDGLHRYAFGVAGDLRFSNDGKSLYVSGYESAINLNNVEYMTFDMPTDGQMSSTEHKDKLLAIGEELNSKINANDAADIIGFGKEWDNYGHYDQDAFYDKFKQNHPDLFDEEDDDYDYYRINGLVKAIVNAGSGNFAGVRGVAAKYTELFTRDDFTGVFTVDTKNRKWVKTADADYFEINFKGLGMGKNYSFRIETSKDYTEWSDVITIKNWDGTNTVYDVTGRAPKKIIGTVKMQNTTIFTGEVGITLNKGAKSLDISTVVNSSNVKVEDVLALRNNSANADLTVYIKGEKILTNNVALTGSQLLNVPEWCEDMQAIVDEYELEHYNEYYYDADGRKIVRKFGKATTNTDLLGKLQVVGHVANYDKSYDDLDKYNYENDTHTSVLDKDKNTHTTTYGSEYWTGKIADVINNYTDASFYYDGKPQPQGFIDWQVYEETYDGNSDGYWDYDRGEYVSYPGLKEIEIEYSLMPYLTFADGSSFAFDSKYFTGSNFKKLVNDAEDIADIINNILEDYGGYEEEYDYRY